MTFLQKTSLALALLMSFGLKGLCQNSHSPIFDSLTVGTEPHVTVSQDARIVHLIDAKMNGEIERATVQTSGYRVQVFSSNEQRTAKVQAFQMEKKMQEAFPDISVYVTYQPPFWKVRMGDFRTSAEAQVLRHEIIQKFPENQGDIYPVKEQIQVMQ